MCGTIIFTVNTGDNKVKTVGFSSTYSVIFTKVNHNRRTMEKYRTTLVRRHSATSKFCPSVSLSRRLKKLYNSEINPKQYERNTTEPRKQPTK